VLGGRLDRWVDDEEHHLEEGDAIRYSSRVPHHNQNPGPGVARVLFIIAPLSY